MHGEEVGWSILKNRMRKRIVIEEVRDGVMAVAVSNASRTGQGDGFS